MHIVHNNTGMNTAYVSGRVPASAAGDETGARRENVQERPRRPLRHREERGDRYPACSFRDSLSGREAFLTGHRVAVWEVVSVHDEVKSVERTTRHFGWPRVLVQRALKYAKAFPRGNRPLM